MLKPHGQGTGWWNQAVSMHTQALLSSCSSPAPLSIPLRWSFMSMSCACESAFEAQVQKHFRNNVSSEWALIRPAVSRAEVCQTVMAVPETHCGACARSYLGFWFVDARSSNRRSRKAYTSSLSRRVSILLMNTIKERPSESSALGLAAFLPWAKRKARAASATVLASARKTDVRSDAVGGLL